MHCVQAFRKTILIGKGLTTYTIKINVIFSTLLLTTSAFSWYLYAILRLCTYIERGMILTQVHRECTRLPWASQLYAYVMQPNTRIHWLITGNIVNGKLAIALETAWHKSDQAIKINEHETGTHQFYAQKTDYQLIHLDCVCLFASSEKNWKDWRLLLRRDVEKPRARNSLKWDHMLCSSLFENMVMWDRIIFQMHRPTCFLVQKIYMYMFYTVHFCDGSYFILSKCRCKTWTTLSFNWL